MSTDIAEIKALLTGIDLRVRALEKSEAGAHPVIANRLEAAEKKLDEHDRIITRLTTLATETKQTLKAISWIGGIVGSSVMGWLVFQILTQIGK